MPAPDPPTSAGPGQVGRPGLGRRLRAGLPSPGDVLLYGALAAALRVFLHYSLPAALAWTAATAAAGIVVFTALTGLTGRARRPAQPGPGTSRPEDDDG